VKTKFFTAKTLAETNIQARRSLVALASDRMAVSLAIASILFSGCSTPVPPVGATSHAGIKWDGNTQDAGIDGGTNLGLPCSQSYRTQYVAWLPKFGAACNAPANPFTPVDVIGKQPWLITGEGAQCFEEMNRASKATNLSYPTPPTPEKK
jgi:hypothetical protein